MAIKLTMLLLLAIAMVTVLAQKRRPKAKAADEWNYRDGSQNVNTRGVSNLTEVLDNWRYDIITQIKGALRNDHQSLLPDYHRIQPLSEALDDLYKEFNALKSHLGELTEKFTAIETFIDEVKAGRSSSPAPGPAPAPAPAPIPGPTRRKVIRKKVISP
uniref:Si:ch211-76l23.4 n=1 Tax=Gadus morhua TaxID=8049 RepID=A0A8C5CRU4_GADMO